VRHPGALNGEVDDPAAAENALSSGRSTTLDVLHDAGAHGLSSVYLASAGLALMAALGTAVFVRRGAQAVLPHAPAGKEAAEAH
jgi:hypothetical protein